MKKGNSKNRVEVVRIKDMNPAPYNPRIDLQPGDEAYEKLRNSMNEFGMVDLIVWNEQTGNIVGGHQRYKILQREGIEETEVMVVNLPMEKEKVLNLALNNISGENDEAKLKALLEEMDEESRALSGVDVEEMFAEIEEELKDEPDIPFTEELHEEHNYIVLYFDNDIDWLNALSEFDIGQVQALDSKEGYRKVGVGRVLKGSVLLNKIRDLEERISKQE